MLAHGVLRRAGSAWCHCRGGTRGSRSPSQPLACPRTWRDVTVPQQAAGTHPGEQGKVLCPAPAAAGLGTLPQVAAPKGTQGCNARAQRQLGAVLGSPRMGAMPGALCLGAMPGAVPRCTDTWLQCWGGAAVRVRRLGAALGLHLLGALVLSCLRAWLQTHCSARGHHAGVRCGGCTEARAQHRGAAGGRSTPGDSPTPPLHVPPRPIPSTLTVSPGTSRSCAWGHPAASHTAPCRTRGAPGAPSSASTTSPGCPHHQSVP